MVYDDSPAMEAGLYPDDENAVADRLDGVMIHNNCENRDFERFDELLGQADRVLGQGLRQDEHELLATVSAERVAGADRVGHQAGNLAQDRVADFWAVLDFILPSEHVIERHAYH